MSGGLSNRRCRFELYNLKCHLQTDRGYSDMYLTSITCLMCFIVRS